MLVQGHVGGVGIVKQEHVDEVDKDAGNMLGHVNVILAPFENDHEHQVSKQAQDKNHLRDELQDDVHSFSEVSGGGERTQNTTHGRNVHINPQSTKCSFLF
jgi:oxalate decarboxylase/phosphoglucose isomerase-like protein (cupin superfamily)